MITITRRFSNTTLCEFDVKTLREAAEKGKANLRGADLGGADLYGANLYGANLYGVDLCRANLGEEKGKLLGGGFFAIGPLGSRKDTLQAFHTTNGVWVKTGCFFDSIQKFREKVVATHGDNNFAFEYLGACTFIEHHFKGQVK